MSCGTGDVSSREVNDSVQTLGEWISKGNDNDTNNGEEDDDDDDEEEMALMITDLGRTFMGTVTNPGPSPLFEFHVFHVFQFHLKEFGVRVCSRLPWLRNPKKAAVWRCPAVSIPPVVSHRESQLAFPEFDVFCMLS